MRKRQVLGNYYDSSIIIMLANNFNATYLCAKRLRFEGILKVVERYWKAKPGLVCSVYCNIAHDWLKKCEQRPAQCTLCMGSYKLEEYKCEINGCKVEFRKICTHIMAMCANCKSS